MNVCPNCGANIEGLIGWCDCCGASITEPEFVILHQHCFNDASDISIYLWALAKELNTQNLSVLLPSISTIELVTYCYPFSLVEENKLRNHSRFYSNTRRAVITIVFDYELFTGKSRTEKKEYVVNQVKGALVDFFEKRNLENLSDIQCIIHSIHIL